jgi:hypothetical protein
MLNVKYDASQISVRHFLAGQGESKESHPVRKTTGYHLGVIKTHRWSTVRSNRLRGCPEAPSSDPGDHETRYR